MPKFVDLTGQRFGRLTVLERWENDRYGHRQWLCRCDCGENKIATTASLKGGYIQSCGCATIEMIRDKRTTHGKCHTKLYNTWMNMKKRCYNERNLDFFYYGGRGIKICDEWLHSFPRFYNWSMANGYVDGLTIDRINVDGDYCPTNCRWVTRKTQGNNTRKNHKITVQGETHTMAEWADMSGLSSSTIRRRLLRGWLAERAVTEPKHKKK